MIDFSKLNSLEDAMEIYYKLYPPVFNPVDDIKYVTSELNFEIQDILIG